MRQGTENNQSGKSISQGKEIVLRTKEVAKQTRKRDVGWFFLKAVILLALLSIVGNCAPYLPPIAFPFIILLYAIPAAIGVMYNVVVKRVHRQYMYNERGKLSHYNRTWLGWFILFFVLALISGFLFVLGAPTWDLYEWILIWLAIPVSYVVFQAVQQVSKKQYTPRFYKARAITWSVVIVGILLCVAYALISTGFSPQGSLDFHEDIANRLRPFADSPCALFCEADKLNTFSAYLTKYGLSYIAGPSFVAALLVKIILSFSVFFGIASQLGCCFLSWKEISGEFQLLPANDEDDADQPFKRRYFAWALILWLALSGAFLGANHAIAQAKATNEGTAVDSFVDDLTDLTVLATESSLEEFTDNAQKGAAETSREEEYQQKRDGLVSEYQQKLIDQVNAYYDACLGNLDSYMDWYDGFAGGFAKLIRPLGEGMAKDEFAKRVTDPVDSSELTNTYAQYCSEMAGLENDFWQAWNSGHPGNPFNASANNQGSSDGEGDSQYNIELWPNWDSDEGKDAIDNILLSAESGADHDSIRAGIEAFINQQRDHALEQVNAVGGQRSEGQ